MDPDSEWTPGANAPAPAKSGAEAGNPPRSGEHVWVQCEGYRTVAYRDSDGKWRTLYDHKELPGNVRIIGPA